MEPPNGTQHWEGDGTLHSYCYDYMRKRGWTETARAFARDAGINEDEWKGPPIEAPQGLLYEWWSVFWDVFISRSQKTGQRNVMADSYVEAMRQKRDPLVVQFPGQPGMAPITLPRSLTHPPRGPPTGEGGPGPRYVANPGQMGRPMQPGEPGRPLPPGSRPPPGPAQQVYHQPPPGFSQPGGPSHLQGGPPHPHAQAPLALAPGMQQGQPYPSGLPQQHPLQAYPQPPGSAHSSPHLAHMAPPFRGQPGGPPPPSLQQQRQQEMSQNHGQMVFAQAMSQVGLGGRDPESLNPEEQSAVHAYIRKTNGGGQPPTPNQQFRPPPQRVVSQQRMHPDMQQPRPPGQPQYPPGMQPPPQPQRQDSQQQMMHHHQQQQQAHHLQREHLNQAARQPQQPPPGVQMHPQMQGYASSQVGSPASPNYSGSPYNAPVQLQQQHGGQGSPPAGFPPPPSSRGGNAKARGGSVASAASTKMSPANSKRGGNLEDPSPRSRKRAKPGGKDDESVPGGTPETPRFDMSGPPSPGTGMPMQGQGLPYQPSRSPLPTDASTRGALDALQSGRMAQQQAGHELINGDMHGLTNGNMSMNGSGNGNGNGNGNGTNGSISRPGSSASNYLNPSGTFQPDIKHSPSAPSPHPSLTGMKDGSGFGDMTPSAMHISLPPPMPPSSFQLGASGTDMTPGGSRPFAGHPHVATPLPMANGGAPLPPVPDAASYQFTGSDDDFLNADLSGLDFAFSSFIDDSIFKDEGHDALVG